MKIRPCIDIHGGKVKQIVGSTLSDTDRDRLKENFVSTKPPGYFANLFREHQLTGGHIIMLGPGNEEAASEALAAWPGGMQVGGGITAENAKLWLDRGASHVIVTSYVFYQGRLDMERLKNLVQVTGKERLVLDLSCRKKDGKYFVVTNRWQKFTKEEITRKTLERLASYCDEFLVHGVDVEGKCLGVDLRLVEMLAEFSPIPTTYAGGAKSIEEAYAVKEKGQGKIDLTIGSALDIFGGTGVTLKEIIRFNQENAS